MMPTRGGNERQQDLWRPPHSGKPTSTHNLSPNGYGQNSGHDDEINRSEQKNNFQRSSSRTLFRTCTMTFDCTAGQG
jgi:hypothetical protein